MSDERGSATQTRAQRKRRKPDEYDDLYAAVARYVEAKGGKALVAGGVAVEYAGEFRYSIIVRCTGRPPVIAGETAR